MARFDATPPPDPLGMFDHAYAGAPPHLERQREAMAARLRAAAGRPAPEPPAAPAVPGPEASRP